ncbi:MAG: transcription-repair coupling factor, partial [Chitinophagales bacterium]|nr:transcription-repair coupling factor [Chitinophagales bacterium]
MLSFYREADVRVKNIIERIDTKDAKNIYLKGIVGSALSFVACGVYKNTNVNHLFILNDREEAAYFLNDLQNLLEKKDILFIPDSFKKPGEFIEVNTNHILQRTEAINKITHSTTKGELIITYP